MAVATNPEYGKFYNGISLSKYIQNGFDSLSNSDIHTELGSVKCQLALAKESGATILDACYQAVAPTGDTYFFSSTDGSIFKRTQAGTYSAVRTNGNGAHKGACYYNSYIWYATSTKLGKFDLSSTWSDSEEDLTAGEHPMLQFDLGLYIGNDNDVAMVDSADTFNGSALDLPVECDILALKDYGDDLLVAEKPGDYITDCKIFRWDTVADSWTISDPIKETSINTFIDADNVIYVQAGDNGNIYMYTGQELQLVNQIRDFDTTTVNHQLSTNYKGRALIANGDTVYSLHSKTQSMETALCGEYTISQSGATIISIRAVGDDLLVAWGDGTDYGVDNISTNRASAVIKTPLFRSYHTIEVGYADLPTGTSISIATQQDGASSFTDQDVEVDSEDKRVVRLKDDLIIKRDCQAQITLNASGVETPVIDNISIK